MFANAPNFRHLPAAHRTKGGAQRRAPWRSFDLEGRKLCANKGLDLRLWRASGPTAYEHRPLVHV
eukprot:11417125-Prorocentrum_lima.AAC.1